MSKRWREVPLKTGEETEVHVGTHGWLVKGSWATLHAGVPTRVAGWAGLRRFCRCPVPVPPPLPLRDAWCHRPSLQKLDGFSPPPRGRELVGHPACGPLGDADLSTRQGPQRSRIYLFPFSPSESAPRPRGRLVLWRREIGRISEFSCARLIPFKLY